jgi:hypothetical protein
VTKNNSTPSIEELFPPLAPGGDEVALPADLAFEADCKAAVAESIEKFEWRFDNALLTRSDKWGLVWRADFTISGNRAETIYINRLTCWRPPGAPGPGVAISRRSASG